MKHKKDENAEVVASLLKNVGGLIIIGVIKELQNLRQQKANILAEISNKQKILNE